MADEKISKLHLPALPLSFQDEKNHNFQLIQTLKYCYSYNIALSHD